MMRRAIIYSVLLAVLALLTVAVTGYLVHRRGGRRPVIIYQCLFLTQRGISAGLTAARRAGSGRRAAEALRGPERSHR